MPEHSKSYNSSKERILNNSELAEWLRELEDKIHQLESQSQSHSVTASKPRTNSVKAK